MTSVFRECDVNNATLKEILAEAARILEHEKRPAMAGKIREAIDEIEYLEAQVAALELGLKGEEP